MTIAGTLTVFGLVMVAGWLALTLLAAVAARHDALPHSHTGARAAVMVILSLACAARLAVVFTTEPLLSDDIWRYIDDGQQLADGRNPYAHSPQHRLDQNMPTDQAIAQRVNHPSLVTIYQPTSQWVFAATYTAAKAAGLTDDPDRWAARDAARVYRLAFSLFDLWLIALLLLKLLRDGRSPWLAALYAWHPLVITEVAWSGHQDVIGIAWLLMALLLVDARGLFDPTGETPRRGLLRASLAGGALALAIGVKPIVAPIALAWCWQQRRQPRRLAVGALACFATLAALYVPFMLMPGGIEGMTHTISAFVNTWSFNSPVHDPMTTLLGSRRAADVLLAAAAVGLMLIVMLRTDDAYRAALVYLLAALLLSSTVHPWYLLWALAFVPLRFSPAVWVFSLTVALSYEVLTHPEQWATPRWVMIGEYAPVALALLASPLLRGRWTRFAARRG